MANTEILMILAIRPSNGCRRNKWIHVQETCTYRLRMT